MEDRKEMMECSEVVEDNTSKNNNEINSISNESKDQSVEVINTETKTKETFNQPNAENDKSSVEKDTSHVFLAPTFAPPISKSKDNAKNNKTLENKNDKSNNKKSEETKDEKIPENKDKNNKERTSDNASKEDDPKPPSENSKKSNPNKKPASNKPVSKRTSDFPYTEPPWGGVCERNYSITVLKDGAVKDTIGLCDCSRVTFGRSDACNVFLEHPSCSRHHAVLQYCHQPEGKRQMGFYLIDLGSTHGTVLNKEVITPEVYNRVRVGYQVKFGGSSRIYIVEGPEEDQEEEGDLDALRQRKLEYQQQKQQKTTSGNKNMQQNDEKQQEDEEEGASWGFGEDAKEETIDLKELFERKKDIEVKDPKKTLRGFFEREGLELEYDVTERTSGRSVVHVATVKLPIDLGEGGEEVIAEGSSSNKKEAVLACATDACKMIQAYDLMQNRSGEDIRELKRRRLEENDFYGSDEDTFLDRTGNIEEKRLKRKKLAGKAKKEKFETHDSLKAELLEKKDELNTCQEKLESSNKAVKESEEGDSLDSFMLTMQNSLEPAVKTKLKRKIVELKKEIEKLERLVEKTKPALLPQLSRKTEASNMPTEDLSITKKSETSHKEKTKPVNETSNAAKETPEKKSATVQSTNKVNISKQSPSKVEDKHTLENSPKTPAKKKKVYTAPTRPSVQKKEEKEEEKDVNWLPPQGQTGDGRTHLNEKFGY